MAHRKENRPPATVSDLLTKKLTPTQRSRGQLVRAAWLLLEARVARLVRVLRAARRRAHGDLCARGLVRTFRPPARVAMRARGLPDPATWKYGG